MQLYVSLAFVGQMIEDLRTILEILGPGLSLIAIGAFLFQRTYAGVVNLQLKRLEAQQQKDKTDAEIKLIQAKTDAELKLADQKTDAEITTRRDKMLDQLISISAKSQETHSESIKAQNATVEVLRTNQTQFANLLNMFTTSRDTDEAYQAKTSVAVNAIQDASRVTKLIVESLPAKLDGNHEKIMTELAAIKGKVDEQYNNLIKQAEESRSQLSASIMKIAVDVAQAAKPELLKPIPEMVADIKATNEPAVDPSAKQPDAQAVIVEPDVVTSAEQADVKPMPAVEEPH